MGEERKEEGLEGEGRVPEQQADDRRRGQPKKNGGEAGRGDAARREIGYNAGGGVMAFFNGRIGVRGDVRYIRSFLNQEPSWTREVDVDIAPSAFDFFRAAGGVTGRIP